MTSNTPSNDDRWLPGVLNIQQMEKLKEYRLI